MAYQRRRILLTNDDGYYSDGIKTLFRQLQRKHDVYLVAPDREQSASSHSLTLNRPLRVHRVSERILTTDGTPTDCVMLAIHLLFNKKHPDMIISGINHGANMGDDITYSGTVAAAIEGSILRIPSMAVSMANHEPNMSMAYAARWTARFVDHFDELGAEPSTFLNINLPPDQGKPYKDFEFTKQGIRLYKDVIVRKRDPRGKPYFWIGGRPKWKTTKGTDFAAVQRGVISITPLRLNFTDLETLDRFKRGGFRM
jgi:5'-nucleotidase